MKIICACLNSKYIHSSLAPWCLKAGVSSFCAEKHSVIVKESTVNGNIFAFADEIINESPDMISFSCYIWNISQTLRMIKYIKDRASCIIVAGGPEAAYNSVELLKAHSYIDYILSGEGEWSFSSLVNKIDANEALSDCEGLSFRNDDRIIINEPLCHKETPPSPYCKEYFEQLNGRIAYIESSRGCPYRCAYCLSGRVSSLRYFDLSVVKDEIIKLSHSGTRTIKFVDRTFNADENKANEILVFIRDNYKTKISDKVCFHFEISAELLSDETVELLSTMPEGLCQLEIGVQSYNKLTLSSINRKCNTEILDKNIRKLIAFKNIHIHTDLIAGLPNENLTSFKNSFNRAFDLRPHMLQVGFLKLLHGADMRENPENYPCEYASEPPYEVLSTPVLSHDDLMIIKDCEKAVDKLYNSRRFLFTIDYIINNCNIPAFEFFSGIGKYINEHFMPIETVITELFSYCCTFADRVIISELIRCDIISTNLNVRIPECLSSYSHYYKRNKKYYSELLQSSIKMVLLDSCDKVYVVSADLRETIDGRYNGKYYDLIK